MNNFLAIIWDFNPTAFSIGTFEIRWYGLLWAGALAVGVWLFSKFVRREGYPSKVMDTMFWCGVISTIVGARLGHCLFYEPGYYLSNPLEILMIRDGGLASHGAAVALPIGLWIFARMTRKEFVGRAKSPYLWALDRIMIVVAIGGAMVRLGNLLNSEIYGGPTNLPWGFIFARNGEDFASHPTQIYEALCYIVLFIVLATMYYKKDMARRYPGLLFGIGLIGVFLSRFLIEFIKNRQEGIDATMGTPLNMGQWLSIPFILLGLFMIWYGLKHKENPKPLPTKEQIAEIERKEKLVKKK